MLKLLALDATGTYLRPRRMIRFMWAMPPISLLAIGGCISPIGDHVGNATEKARHVVIIGGGNIGSYVASELEKISGIRARIIERDKKQAELGG